jgi:hypothetical protein
MSPASAVTAVKAKVKADISNPALAWYGLTFKLCWLRLPMQKESHLAM